MAVIENVALSDAAMEWLTKRAEQRGHSVAEEAAEVLLESLIGVDQPAARPEAGFNPITGMLKLAESGGN